ncbi:MBL fold metallo-hydrolase [Hyphomonas johnsonii]|uniref:Metallo-beta-lactamase family protein n=1 Tax=Hyphomonas johnsonii MHS-2 TaxID=1280950 RepID=A0A059FG27_9PROT|nr:MBL fold metallo-hydrolase [Hyphomonas johnsonii]KCZ89501.1 metallo-beta-lactamase family protein [Hyphomonas johnsonii MHS-2]
MDGFQTKTRKRPNLAYPHGEARPGLAETIRVAPGIEWVSMPLPFSLKFINLWLIDDGDSWTIVDTGLPLPETRTAWKSLIEARITPDKPLKRVMVTHMHPDHVGCAGWLCHKYGAALWMSRLEYTTCRMLVADTGREAPKTGVDFYRRAGWDDAQIADYQKRFGGFGRGVSQMPDAFHRLADGGAFRMAGQDWEVIIGNGHSPEHACLYCPALNLLISGDQLLPRISSNVSVHPTEPDADPLLDWMDSCQKLLDRLPEDVLVLPAHNEPFRGAHARLRHLIDGHETGLARLKRRMESGPIKVMDTFTSLFGRAIAADEVGMATGEAIAHLNCLIHRGEVVAHTGDDGVSRYSLV